MLQPKNVKYRRVHRPNLSVYKGKSANLVFGIYGLKSLETGIVSSRELQAGKMAIKRKLKKTGSTWLRIYPSTPITGKKTGVRMGKGKGLVVGWVCSVGQGQIIYELAGISKELAFTVLRIVSSKLSVKTKIVILKE